SPATSASRPTCARACSRGTSRASATPRRGFAGRASRSSGSPSSPGRSRRASRAPSWRRRSCPGISIDSRPSSATTSSPRCWRRCRDSCRPATSASTSPPAARPRSDPLTAVPRIALLPGDGIGPEVVGAAAELLGALGEFEFREHPVGGASIDAHGSALTDEVLAACADADAVLLGAVGGPRGDTPDPHAPRPEQGLMALRRGLGLYANLRPVRPSPALAGASPLRPAVLAGNGFALLPRAP